ncbi:MAG: hypothetical protein CSA38_03365 [Flavobacteriales bacterium]|nr:MAG: hypothetical protein CSA38_03365 [Flavobacteriales bacterium]
MKLKLKKIDPIKYSLICSLIVGVVMFLTFALLSVFGGFMSSIIGDEIGKMGLIFGGSFFILIFVAFFYMVITFIFSLISIVIFNFVLSKTGGLEMEFENQDYEQLTNN